MGDKLSDECGGNPDERVARTAHEQLRTHAHDANGQQHHQRLRPKVARYTVTDVAKRFRRGILSIIPTMLSGSSSSARCQPIQRGRCRTTILLPEPALGP